MDTNPVEALDSENFSVTVNASSRTEHAIDVSTAYTAQLHQGHCSTAELVKKSFKFLLERAFNTSILRQYDLRMIGRYFPEYENHICK